jgi:hypothetical protein
MKMILAEWPAMTKLAIDEINAEMESLGREERPDYQKWIDRLRQLKEGILFYMKLIEPLRTALI